MREITRFHKNRHAELVSASSDTVDTEILQEYFQDSLRESGGVSSG